MPSKSDGSHNLKWPHNTTLTKIYNTINNLFVTILTIFDKKQFFLYQLVFNQMMNVKGSAVYLLPQPRGTIFK